MDFSHCQISGNLKKMVCEALVELFHLGAE